MPATSSLSSLAFTGSIFLSDTHYRSPSSNVQFRPLRVSANCATTSERTTSAYVSRPQAAGSFYEVLGIQMGANCQEIKAAYRRLARVLHPDVVADDKENTANEFIRVHEAYETLSDPEKRADYDQSLFWRGRQMSSSFVTSAMAGSSASGFSSGFTRRRWETDQCW